MREETTQGNLFVNFLPKEKGYLFFDTETTGLPRNWNAPVTDLDNWPRLVQLAWKLYDEKGVFLESGNKIIKPEGFIIPKESSNIHGITTELASKEGSSLLDVLIVFKKMVDLSEFIIGHNISYDEKIIRAEFLRKGMGDPLNKKNLICTKEGGVEICAIQGPYGYKWPKLSELYQKLFGKDFSGAHNALADVTATADCFWEMRKRGIL